MLNSDDDGADKSPSEHACPQSLLHAHIHVARARAVIRIGVAEQQEIPRYSYLS